MKEVAVDIDGQGSNISVIVVINVEEEEEVSTVKNKEQEQQQPRPLHSRQWLIDRTQGTSHHDRPPLSCCWVPALVRRFPRVLEQNGCCESIGAVGFAKAIGENRTRRRRFMTVSAVCNVIGFLLTILACLAMSTNYSILTAFSFTNGHIQSSIGNADNSNSNSFDFKPVKMALGLRAVATENIWIKNSYNNNRYSYQQQSQATVYTFDEFCDLPQHDLSRFFPPGSCESCRDVSSTLMISLAISLLAYIPALFTSFGRMYYNYDVNCRKTLALVTTLLSFGMALKTVLGYKNNCYSDAYQVQVPLNVTVTTTQQQQQHVTSSNEAVVTAMFDWNGGLGLLCLFLAMGLKLLEITLHALLPSPSIARNRHEQAAYEQQKQEKLQQQQEQQQHQEQYINNNNNKRQSQNQPTTLMVSDNEGDEENENNKIPGTDEHPSNTIMEQRGCP